MKFRTKAGVIVSAFFFLGLAGMQVYADETEIVEESTDTEIQNEPTITYYSHVSMIGDTDPVENGEMTGTEGKGLQMEALSIELDSGDYSGDIEYCAHVENIGWQDYVSSSSTAGFSSVTSDVVSAVSSSAFVSFMVSSTNSSIPAMSTICGLFVHATVAVKSTAVKITPKILRFFLYLIVFLLS